MIRDSLRAQLEFDLVELPVISAYVDSTRDRDGSSSNDGATEAPPPLRSWRRHKTHKREYRPSTARMRVLLDEHKKALPIRGEATASGPQVVGTTTRTPGMDDTRLDTDRVIGCLTERATQLYAVWPSSSVGVGLWHALEPPATVDTLVLDAAFNTGRWRHAKPTLWLPPCSGGRPTRPAAASSPTI